jgi:uncharacterized iron-regulated protein
MMPDLLSLQQAMVRRQKRRMKSFIEQTPELEAYYEEYRRELREFEVLSFPGEVQERMALCDVVYVGDFHTLLQSQKLAAKLLRMLSARTEMKDRRLVFAMETFLSAHQAHLDRYLAGKLAIDGLLETVNYKRNWGFPSEGYVELLETCKEQGFEVMGINSNPRGSADKLAARDDHAARLIAGRLEAQPGCLIVVLIGDLHVATNHLPLKVLERMDQKGLQFRDLIVYTNSETLYWDLARMGLEYMVNVVKLDSRRFCIINSTPLAKYDSFLRFMEGTVDDGDEELMEEALPLGVDVQEQIREFARRMAAFLELPGLRLPEVEVVTFDDPFETVRELCARRDVPASEVGGITGALRARLPVFVGRFGILLHRYSLNDVADAAARLLLRTLGWRQDFKGNANSFYGLVLSEALAYFASKVINPKRTCKRLEDLEAWSAKGRRQALRRSGKRRGTGYDRPAMIRDCVVPHVRSLPGYCDDEVPRPEPDPGSWAAPTHRRIDAAHTIGTLLGERLFFSSQVGLPASYLKAGKNRRLNRRQIAALMQRPPDPTGDVFPHYLSVWEATADVVEHHSSRGEWL